MPRARRGAAKPSEKTPILDPTLRGAKKYDLTVNLAAWPSDLPSGTGAEPDSGARRNWIPIGRISAERDYVHYDVSPVIHGFLWVSGLMSWFRLAEMRPIRRLINDSATRYVFVI